jgi:hypothetical protein
LSLLINSNNPIKHPGKFHSITFAYSNIQCFSDKEKTKKMRKQALFEGGLWRREKQVVKEEIGEGSMVLAVPGMQRSV